MTRASRSLRARPPLPTHSAAGRVLPAASVTRIRTTKSSPGVAAEADDVAEPEFVEEGEQLAVAKAAVGKDRDGAGRRHEFLQPHQARILESIALRGQFLLPDGQPQQGRCPPVPSDQAEHQRGLPIPVELGPVHRNQHFPTRTDLMGNPMGEAVPHVDALVAYQPIYLLDRVLGHQAPRLGERLADHRDRQRRARHYPKRRPSQRIDALGVQVMPIQPAYERTHIPKPPPQPLRLAHVHAPFRNHRSFYGTRSNRA